MRQKTTSLLPAIVALGFAFIGSTMIYVLPLFADEDAGKTAGAADAARDAAPQSSVIGGSSSSVVSGLLPPGAIPSKRYVEGQHLIVAWNEDGDILWGYSEPLGEWTTLRIPKRQRPPVPIVAAFVAVFQATDRLYAFSATTGRWDELKTKVLPTVELRRIIVEDDKVHIFSDSSGRWVSPNDSLEGPNPKSKGTTPPPPLVDATGRPIELADVDNDGSLDAVLQAPTLGLNPSSYKLEFAQPPPSMTAGSVLDSLSSHYKAIEAEVEKTALEIRRARPGLAENGAALAKSKSNLEKLVTAAFESRQNAQRLEAEIARHRLQQVDARLAERERLKTQITERRLQELLDPNLDWDSSRTRPREPADDTKYEFALADDKPAEPASSATKSKPRTSYPQIASTSPKQGATGVDPDLKEISVTFDRDMNTGRNWSWTGGPPLFPPPDESRPIHWSDERTCVLPVKVERGNYYRVGINSTSHQNFRSRDGVPVPPSAVWLATTGASAEVESRVRVPTVVSIEPANGAAEVDPATTEIRVTFSVPMGDGFSWTGSGPNSPKGPKGSKATWSEDRLTCTLPVSLEPNHDYRLGLNSLNHINFQSEWGVPLQPVGYSFHTRGTEK